MKKPTKILMLASDPLIFNQVQFELKKSGMNYTSQMVLAREEYEKALCSVRPDVILADYAVAGFDEFWSFKIRQKVSPDIPFILVSDRIGEENAVGLIRMGVTDYVLKEKLYPLASKILQALKEAADRKQQQKAQRQLKLARKIMDLSRDLICTLDQKGRFAAVGEACRSILGYLPQELIGSRVIELAHEEDLREALTAIAELKNGRDLVNFEKRFIRKNGTAVVLSWSAHWDPDERLAYCVARDITEIRAAEEKVKHNEKRLRALLQNSSDGLSLLAADGRIIERSPASLKILGYEADRAPEKIRPGLIHPDDLPAVKEVYAQVKAAPNHKRTIECRYQMPDGSYKWLEVTLHNQLQEPAVEAIVLNYRDITESKSAVIALQKSEARLKEAQAVGHIGHWEVDWADGAITWSDELYRIYGLDRQAVEPSLDVFASVIHPEDRAKVLDEFTRKSMGLQNGFMEFRIQRSDGQVRHITSQWRFEFDEKGKPIRLFGIVQDITENKLAEIALEESEAKYHSLFNLSPTPMWVYDEQTLCFLEVNEAAIRHYGYSQEEFLAMTLKDIRPRKELGKLQELAGTPKDATTHYRDVFRHMRKSGEVMEVEIKVSPVDLSGRKARLVIATDVSRQLQYIHAIKDQNQRLREIAWTQSHVVRAPLARLLGLVGLLKDYAIEKVYGCNILDLILSSAHELDKVIKEIVRKTEQVNTQPIRE